MPRDASGNVSLPPGNPVISGSDITSDWANTTMADIRVMLEDSLDRNGKGGMQAPLLFDDGAAVSPSISFANDTSTGLYRSVVSSVSGLGVTVGNAVRALFTSTLATISTALLVQGKASLAAGLDLTNTVTNTIKSYVADRAGAVALDVDTSTTLTNSSARLQSLKNNGAEKWAVDKDGVLIAGTIPTNRIGTSGANRVDRKTITAGTNAWSTAVTSGSMALSTSPVLITVNGSTGSDHLLDLTVSSGAADERLELVIQRAKTSDMLFDTVIDTRYIFTNELGVSATYGEVWGNCWMCIDIPPAETSYTYRVTGSGTGSSSTAVYHVDTYLTITIL